MSLNVVVIVVQMKNLQNPSKRWWKITSRSIDKKPLNSLKNWQKKIEKSKYLIKKTPQPMSRKKNQKVSKNQEVERNKNQTMEWSKVGIT